MISSLHPEDSTLHEYLDNELPPSKVQELRAHLEVCAACSQKAAELRQLFHTLDAYHSPALKSDLSSKVLNQLVKQDSQVYGTQHAQPVVNVAVGVQVILTVILLTISLPIVLPYWLESLTLPSLKNTSEMITNNLGQEISSWLIAFGQVQNRLMDAFVITSQTWLSNLPLVAFVIFLGVTAVIWLAGNSLLLRQNHQIHNRSKSM